MSLREAFDLSGSVAVVTGATRGLGRAASLALAEGGARVAVTGRRPELLASLCDEVVEAGGTASAHVLDVDDTAQVDQVMEDIARELGPPDVLLNNAGIERQLRLEEMEPEDWESVLDTNLGAVIGCGRAFLREFRGSAGSIINVSSVGAAAGVAGQSAYCASKGGVASLTRALGVELARNSIRVNAIAPGYFATDMPAEVIEDPAAKDKLLRQVPLRRLGEPEEIGPLVVYLAAPASAFMTGSVIYLDGGFTAR